MPRYFFHLHCAAKTVSDPTGAELRDPDQVWEAARTTARELMQTEAAADVHWLSCHFEVAGRRARSSSSCRSPRWWRSRASRTDAKGAITCSVRRYQQKERSLPGPFPK